ncbi:hypothetical protein GCM10009654_56810 [Streptomyces hebeiensis]|uniref:GntR C-terminal domain-containing protein n=1 Tax=Streptomyces hebeiensis TaxID=229486 RepID=A0ABN1V2S9_9ACTN
MIDVKAVADRVKQIQLDHKCHASTVALTGSRRLVEIHAQLLTESRLAAITAGLADGDIVPLSHREFVNLLQEGRAEAACAQLARRLEVARDHAAQRLPQCGVQRPHQGDLRGSGTALPTPAEHVGVNGTVIGVDRGPERSTPPPR